MRKLLIGLGIVAVLLVAVAFAGPLFVPTDRIKSDIAAEVEKATGRQLTIDGNLSFRFLPAPGVSASGVKLSNAEQGSSPDMISLEGATVEVALMPLISGDVQVTRIVLREPVILLEQYADGTNNWTFDTAGAADDAGAGETGSGEGDGTSSGAPAIRFDNVEIVDGTLIYSSADQTERVENVDMTFGAGSLAGPFRADGSLTARGFDIELNAAVGELVGGKATPINTRISTAGARIDYSGVYSDAGETPRVSGQVEVRADDLSALIAGLGNGAPPAALRGKALELDGTVAASPSAVSVNNLELRLGQDSATGAIDVTLGDDITANAVLNMAQLDLDRLLAETGGGSAQTSGSGTGEEASPARASGSQDSGGPAAGFTLPENVSASLETKVDTVVYRGGVIRQVLLNAEMAQGVLNISRASAQLPGSSTASLVGLVSPAESGMTFDGQGEVASDNFRSLLQWAGADVSAVAPERLRKMAGSMAVSATPENVTLTDIDVSVDVSRLRGGVAIALRERPGFGIGLSLDKINVDAYLPQEETAAASAGAASGGTSGGGDTGGTDRSPAGGNASPLAALNAFDAILQLKVGDLTYQEQRLQGINVDGTLQGGVLELRDASVANLEGAKVSAKGRLEDLASEPTADLTIAVDAPDADALLALAGVTPPAPLGPGKLEGAFRGDLDNLNIDATVQALGANLKAAGTLAPLADPLSYDLKVDLRHPDASAFFARVGGDAGASGVKTGTLAAAITAKGNVNATNFAANVGVGEGRVVAQGNLDNLSAGAPRGAVNLDVNHPDMVAFVRTFANDYQPALAQAGPFTLKTEVALQPDAITLSGLEGKAGPVTYSGVGQLATGGARPSLTAELTTSEIVVDWFLPKPSSSGSSSGGGAGGGGSASAGGSSGRGGERWSRERLDLSALSALDANVKVSTPAITYSDIKVDNPQLAFTLDDGVFNLNRLSGNAFGGGFGMTAQVADREIPTMQYALKVEGADAAKFLGGASSGTDKGVASALEVLFPVSSLKLVSGTLNTDMKVSSRGRSEFEMISNLGGDGTVQFSNAVVDGVDVCRISNLLDNINGLESLLGLVTTTRGGQTKVNNFDGRFNIANGVATLPQQTIDADCANVVFSGTTNLPAWTVDLQATASFPAHPEFPGLVVEQKGSLDAPNTRLVNLNAINQFIAGKTAGTVLRKVAPDIQKVIPKELNNLLPGLTGRQQAPAQQAPAEGTGEQLNNEPAPAEQPEPAKQFQNLLEGLIRGR